jgi:hypothetical protein
MSTIISPHTICSQSIISQKSSFAHADLLIFAEGSLQLYALKSLEFFNS